MISEPSLTKSEPANSFAPRRRTSGSPRNGLLNQGVIQSQHLRQFFLGRLASSVAIKIAVISLKSNTQAETRSFADMHFR